jgi:L-lactate transport
MWQQTYTPLGDSLGLSALAASIPLIVILFLLAVARKPSWMAALAGCGAAALVAVLVYGMPAGAAASSITYGVAYGLLPIGWIVFTAVLLYKLTVETGKFEIIKDSIASLTGDRRLHALLVAFAFGAFIEGAAGFGTPVAVAAAMLTGLGFQPFYAAAICLLANTAPVAFGSIGTPLVMLQSVTGLPMEALSGNVGRICAPLSLIVPSYLMLVMGGVSALRAVFPAAAVCGITFATTQFLVSNYLGPYLTDILGSLIALVSLVLLMLVWKPKGAAPAPPHKYTTGQVFSAWMPYVFLVIFVLLWGHPDIKAWLDRVGTWSFGWPGLDGHVARVPPIVEKTGSYAARYSLSLLSASGTSCLFAVFASAIFFKVPPGKLAGWIGQTAKQLMLPMVTISAMLGIAYLMNYSGATATLGLVVAGTGSLFPFLGSWLGSLGVFLTGSDTSANALFGSLQVVTSTRLGINPALMAAANSSVGVMGKMISLQNIAVAAAATGMARDEEAKLFRFTLRHSLFLAFVMAMLVVFYAYVARGWVR